MASKNIWEFVLRMEFPELFKAKRHSSLVGMFNSPGSEFELIGYKYNLKIGTMGPIYVSSISRKPLFGFKVADAPVCIVHPMKIRWTAVAAKRLSRLEDGLTRHHIWSTPFSTCPFCRHIMVEKSEHCEGCVRPFPTICLEQQHFCGDVAHLNIKDGNNLLDFIGFCLADWLCVDATKVKPEQLYKSLKTFKF